MQRTVGTTASLGPSVRWAALGGVVGPVTFAVVVILAGAMYDGYSHVTQKVSELGGEGAPHAVVQNVNFLLLGAMVIGFAWSLGRRFGHGWPGPLLVGVFGVSSCIANALFPCDAACRGETTIGLLHNVTGITGFVAALVGMVLLSRRWRDDPIWRSHVGFTRAAAAIGGAGLVWFIATQALDAQAYAGVAQRAFIVALLSWIAVTAYRLVRELEADVAPAATVRGGVQP